MYSLGHLKQQIQFATASVLLGFSAATLASNADYQTAVKLFEQQSYQQAYERFSKLVESDYSSIDYSFYLARSAQELNKPEEAIAAYERILILQPDHTRSKLELGKLYYEVGQNTLSRSYFSSAIRDGIPETVRNNVDRYLAEIDGKTEQTTLSGALMIGAGYDSNLNGAPYASSWYVPVFGTEFTNTTDKASGLYHQEMAIINHHYDATEKYGFAINNSLLAYNKSIPSESNYNILYFRYKPSLIFDYAGYQIDAGLQLDTMQYGGDAYLQTYGLTPSVARNIDNNSYVTVGLKWLKKDYQKTSDQGRDANHLELGASYHQRLSNRSAWHIDGELVQERKESGTLTDVSYDAIRLMSGVNYQWFDDIRVGGELSLTQTHYTDTSAFFLNKRQDSNIKLALDISKVINKEYSLQLRAERMQNNSNQASYEYDKDQLLINLIKKF